MTKELAIRILTGDVLGTSEQTHEAIKMAVRALSQPDVADTNVGDMISRQAAIEAIKGDKIDLTNPNVVAVFKATGDFEKVETQVMTCDRHIKILKDLPSAQSEIIHCEFCEHWKNNHLCECLSRHGRFETPKDFFCGYGKEK